MFVYGTRESAAWPVRARRAPEPEGLRIVLLVKHGDGRLHARVDRAEVRVGPSLANRELEGLATVDKVAIPNAGLAARRA